MSKKKNRPDNSPFVYQEPKINWDLSIRDRFRLSPCQQSVLDAALDRSVRMVVLDGVAGTSKTFLGVLAALRLIQAKSISGLAYFRSTVQAKDGQIGFLPGGLDLKFQYYCQPLHDKLEELLPLDQIKRLEKEERILSVPTSMLRGHQFNCKCLLVDEAQNIGWDSLFTIVSRAGMFTKVVVMGDSEMQNDLGQSSGFPRFCGIFSDEESHNHGVRYFKLGTQEIVRSPFVKFLVEKVRKASQA